MTKRGLAAAGLLGLVLVASSCSWPAGEKGERESERERERERPRLRRRPLVLPRFERTVLLETTSETSANVAAGDLNGDGNLDLVLAKGRHWPLLDRVLLGDGHGAFPSAYDLGTVADRSYSARLADFDGDGILDVAVSNDSPDPKVVYLNDGKGHFRPASVFGNPEWPTRNAAVADLNRDGRPDLVVANRSGDQPGADYVCLNHGQGRFDSECIAFAHESSTTITPADLDRDDRMDLVVPHRDGGQSYVYLQTPVGFPDLERVPFGPKDATIRIAEVADIDGDGLPDIVASDERSGISVYFNALEMGRVARRFTDGKPVGPKGAVPYALAVGDLNGDGRTDLVVGYVEAPSVVYVNDGGHSFKPVRFGDGKGTVYGFAIGDFDKDGHPDIAAARSEAPNVLYLASPSKEGSR